MSEAGQGGDTGQGGGGGVQPGPMDWLPESYRARDAFKGMRGLEDLAKGYEGQLKLLGVPKEQLIRIPQSEDDKEGWGAYRKAIGVPDAPERYDFRPVEGAPEFHAGTVARMRQILLDADVPTASGNKVFSGLSGVMKDLAKELTDDANQKRAAAEAQMKADFGNEYADRVAATGQAAKWIDGQLKGTAFYDLLKSTGLGSDPTMIRALDVIARQLGADTLNGEGGNGGGFKDKQSKAEAEAALQAFDSDADIRAKLADKTHPERKALLDKRMELIAAAEG